MTDREKVVNGLRCCSAMSGEYCRKCPYQDECRDDYGIPHLANDALELLETLEKRCNALDTLEDPDRIKVTRCKDCRYFEPSNAEEGDYSGYCRNDYAPCQNQTVDAWWFCGSAERVSE